MASDQGIVDRKEFKQSICLPLIPLSLTFAACSAPLLLQYSPTFGFVLQQAFALVCHQQPNRSFVLFGGTVAVCARCLGVYTGAAIGLLFKLPRELAWKLLVTAFAINGLDWLTEVAGLHNNWMLWRFALGVALGIAGVALVRSDAFESAVPPCDAAISISRTHLRATQCAAQSPRRSIAILRARESTVPSPPAAIHKSQTEG